MPTARSSGLLCNGDCRHEITAAGVAADFHKVKVAASAGVGLIRLVSDHIADLNAIRLQALSRALPSSRALPPQS
jgi:hypothetical protein